MEVDITLEYRAYRDRKEVCSGYCLLGKQSYDINDRHFSQALQLTPLADPLQRFKEQAPGLAEYCAQQGLETRVVLGYPFCIRESCLAEAYPQEAPGKKTAEISYFFRNRPRR